MTDVYIIIAKYLFMVYIAVFVFNGLMINLAKQDMARFNIIAGLSAQRVCIALFHITASVILIANSLEYDMQPVVLYCILSFVITIGGNALTRTLYPDGSHTLYNCVFFLMDLGLIMLYRLDTSLAEKQLIWNTLGIVMMLVMPKLLEIAPRLDKFRNIYIILAFVLLAATLIFGKDEGGATNWLSIGPIGFQPSEIIKVLFVFYLASSFAEKPSFKELIIPAILSAAVVLCLVAQTDLGSALIFYMTFLIMVFVATCNYLYFIFGIGAISFASVIAYNLFSHIQTRVQAWQNPWLDVNDKGYQIAQSLFAICTWGITGIGFTRGYANSIPVVERDFIFAAICEEFGVIFAAGLILVFVLIFLEGARGALENRNRFLTLLCTGFTALFAFQSFLIIGGVIKMIPLTGVTLPFVSYGGTSIVISYIIIAAMQWIIMRNEGYSHDKPIEEVDTRVRRAQTKKALERPSRRNADEGKAQTVQKNTKRKTETVQRSAKPKTEAVQRPARRKAEPVRSRAESTQRPARHKTAQSAAKERGNRK